ncbi:MAG: RNA polymerase sporulation sigma factor SigE [Oscillospiraceae bacterium]
MFNRIVKFFKDYIEKLRICIALPDYIYYINGSETLPPPLSQDEEKVVFAGLEEGRQSCKDILIVHNLRLVVYIAKKFESSGIPIEDIISIGTIGLIKAVNTFVPSKNIKLATYASRCIENEILMYLRKSSNRRQESSIDEPLNVDCDGNELLLSDVLGSDQNLVSQELEQAAERSMVLDAVENLGERERQIMQLRFGLLDGKEHTQKEVADLIGISQSYISRLEKRIIKRLRRDLEHIA